MFPIKRWEHSIAFCGFGKVFFIVEKFFNLKTFSQVGTVDEKRHDNRGDSWTDSTINEPEKHEVLVISLASASAEKLFPRSVPWVI